MSQEKIVVGSRVAVCNANHPALKFGQGGEVVGITDKAQVKVVFDASTVGRGFVDTLDAEDLRIECWKYTDSELHDFLEKEFKKSRPVLPKRFILVDEDDESTSTWELDRVFDFCVHYREVDGISKTGPLSINFEQHNLYQFSRLLSVRKYQSFTIG